MAGAGFGNEESVNVAEDDKSADRGQRRDGPRQVPLDEHDRKQHALQRHGGSDGEINSAGDDDNAEADAEDSEHPNKLGLIAEVGFGKKSRVFDRDGNAEHREESTDSNFFFHHADCVLAGYGQMN